jgi:hypothetical protein
MCCASSDRPYSDESTEPKPKGRAAPQAVDQTAARTEQTQDEKGWNQTARLPDFVRRGFAPSTSAL